MTENVIDQTAPEAEAVQQRKTEQFVLALPVKVNPEMVVPALRNDDRAVIERIIENESLIDAETGKADWIKGSQLESFVHPSVLTEQGFDPISQIRLEDWLAEMTKQVTAQWDLQILEIPERLDRMSSNPFKKLN